MKKFFTFAVTAMAILGLGSLTSCQEEDFDVSTAVLQERAFEQGFIEEFGKPSADQRWDFYAQKMENLFGSTTRATMAEDPVCKVTKGVEQQYDKNWFRTSLIQNFQLEKITLIRDRIPIL